MKIKLFLFVMLLCVLQTPEVESQEFIKNAYKSVKNAVVKGYHHVASIFVKDDDNEETAKVEEIVEIAETENSTPLEDLINIRFKEKTEETTPSLLRNDKTEDDVDKVPDLNNRFFINAPCGDGTRRSGNGCRQVIN